MRFPQQSVSAAAPLVAALVLALSARSQDAVRADPAVVGLIGASVSAGFVDPKPLADGEPNSTVKLAVALRPLWERGDVRVRDRSDLSTFLDPIGKQQKHLDRVIADAPHVVVAVDFMFWFGYGRVAGEERAARLALQRRGLALLEKLEVPVLVGDYPDMHGADPRMLSPAQIPSLAVLEELNGRLREWADGRTNVRVFPLAEFVARAKGDGIGVHHGDADLLLRRDVLLQGDGLHATRLGMALLSERVQRELAALLPENHPARPREIPLAELCETARAGLLLEELAASAKPAAGVGGGR